MTFLLVSKLSRDHNLFIGFQRRDESNRQNSIAFLKLKKEIFLTSLSFKSLAPGLWKIPKWPAISETGQWSKTRNEGNPELFSQGPVTKLLRVFSRSLC